MLSEGLLSKVVYRDKEKVAWRMMRVLIETKYNSGSVEVQGSQVRVIRISRDFCGDSGRSHVRHPVGTNKPVIEDREELIGDGGILQRTERGYKA